MPWCRESIHRSPNRSPDRCVWWRGW
jgi:hypothetical protein